MISLKVVSLIISLISAVNWLISVEMAFRSAEPSVSLAAWVTFPLMVMRISLIFSRPPSAMARTFLAVPTLFRAVDSPRERARRRVEMTKPAGSSDTSLIRKPVASFNCDRSSRALIDFNEPRAFKAAMFVLIRVESPIAMRNLLVKERKLTPGFEEPVSPCTSLTICGKVKRSAREYLGCLIYRHA